jgi:hypothetical protein
MDGTTLRALRLAGVDPHTGLGWIIEPYAIELIQSQRVFLPPIDVPKARNARRR